VPFRTALVHLRVLQLQAEDLPAMRSQGLNGASSFSVSQTNPKILQFPSAMAHGALRLRKKEYLITRDQRPTSALHKPPTPQNCYQNMLLTRTQMEGRCKWGSTEFRLGSLTEPTHPVSLPRSPTATRILSPAAGCSHFHWPAFIISLPFHCILFFCSSASHIHGGFVRI
jgi:hypothetical protein